MAFQAQRQLNGYNKLISQWPNFCFSFRFFFLFSFLFFFPLDEETKLDSYFGRLRFLGKVLKAEKASKPTQNDNKTQPGCNEAQSSNDLMSPAPTLSLVQNTGFSKDNAAEQVSKSGSLPDAEPIARRLGVDYPFPPHLEYVDFLYFFQLNTYILYKNMFVCLGFL